MRTRRLLIAAAAAVPTGAAAGLACVVFAIPNGAPSSAEVEEVVRARLEYIRGRFLEGDLTPLPGEIKDRIRGYPMSGLKPQARAARVTSLTSGHFSRYGRVRWQGDVTLNISIPMTFAPVISNFRVVARVLMLARYGGWDCTGFGRVDVVELEPTVLLTDQ